MSAVSPRFEVHVDMPISLKGEARVLTALANKSDCRFGRIIEAGDRLIEIYTDFATHEDASGFRDEAEKHLNSYSHKKQRGELFCVSVGRSCTIHAVPPERVEPAAQRPQPDDPMKRLLDHAAAEDID